MQQLILQHNPSIIEDGLNMVELGIPVSYVYQLHKYFPHVERTILFWVVCQVQS